MKIQINFKKVKNSEPLKEYAEEKLSRELEKFRHNLDSAEITISKKGHNYTASCQLKGGASFSSFVESQGEETHSAIDGMIKKIDSVLRKKKEKLRKHREHHSAPKGYEEYNFEDSYLEGEVEEHTNKKQKKSS